MPDRRPNGRVAKVSEAKRIAAMNHLAAAAGTVGSEIGPGVVDVGLVIGDVAEALMALGCTVDANEGGFEEPAELTAELKVS